MTEIDTVIHVILPFIFPLSASTEAYPKYPILFVVILTSTILFVITLLTLKGMRKIDIVIYIDFLLFFTYLYNTLSTSVETYTTIYFSSLILTMIYGTILLTSIFYKFYQNAKKKKILSIFQIDLNSN